MNTWISYMNIARLQMSASQYTDLLRATQTCREMMTITYVLEVNWMNAWMNEINFYSLHVVGGILDTRIADCGNRLYICMMMINSLEVSPHTMWYGKLSDRHNEYIYPIK